MDDFWLLTVLFASIPLLLPLMRRIRLEATPAADTATARTPADTAAAEPARAPLVERDVA
jgi:hypothetical protein